MRECSRQGMDRVGDFLAPTRPIVCNRPNGVKDPTLRQLVE